MPVMGAWALFAAVAVAVGLFPPANRTPYPYGSFPAGIDNLMLPLAALVVTWWWVSRFPGLNLVRVATKAIVFALSANAALTLLYFGSPPSWLRMFWASGEGQTVADRATQLGRYTGIFNQPAEAGIAYSLGLFCLVYVLHTSEAHRRSLYFLVSGTLLTVGGVVTTSKVFIIGGLPLVAYLILRNRRRRANLIALSLVALVGYLVVRAMGWLPQWDGSAMISRLLGVRGQTFLSVFTAGRLGEGGTLGASTASVMENHLGFGVGAQGLAVAYDSAWVEALVVAGAVGTVLLAAVFLALLLRWWSLRGCLPRPEWMLGGAVALLLLGGSLGVPSLTGNRVSTLAWVLLGLLIVSRSPRDDRSLLSDGNSGGLMTALRPRAR